MKRNTEIGDGDVIFNDTELTDDLVMHKVLFPPLVTLMTRTDIASSCSKQEATLLLMINPVTAKLEAAALLLTSDLGAGDLGKNQGNDEPTEDPSQDEQK